MKKQESHSTTDHNTIKKWAEAREGRPAVVKSTKDTAQGAGILRINFPGYEEKDLENITWEKFFDIFDKNNLEFLYQEKTADGGTSRFNKFINKP